MSESEKKGRCRQQLEAWFALNISSVPRYSWMIADAIDRLAADVASVMEMTREIALRVPSELGRDACDVAVRVLERERDAAIRERDEARALLELAQVQRTAAYADRDEARAEVYQVKCSRTETSKERDAAIRERDEARAEVERLKESRDVANRLYGAAQAEVERLRKELDDRKQTEQVKRLREANKTLHRKSINYIHDRDQYRRERDQERAEVERLKNELYDREQEILSLRADTVERYEPPAATQPAGHGISQKVADTQSAGNAAPAPGWLTEEERAVVEDIASMIQQWFKMAWSDTDEKRCAVLRSILARAGSPPVVKVPAMIDGYKSVLHWLYRTALDNAGVKWKEVGRE